MTPASLDTLAWLEAQRAMWAERDDGDDSYGRAQARAVCRVLRTILDRLPGDLARVEAAAVAEHEALVAHIDRVLDTVP